MTRELKPIDGTVVVLHLIEAVREWYHHRADPHAISDRVAELERWLSELRPAPRAVEWKPRPWREVLAGDRVALGGVEAVVESAQLQGWHVDPRSSEYRPVPLEHQVMAVRLAGRTPLYAMPPDGEIEVLRGPAGQAVDEAADLAALDPQHILASWAGEAYETLAAANLRPTVIPHYYGPSEPGA